MEYLTQQREQHRPSKKKGPEAKVGDIVLIQEDNIKRLNWPIAVIESLLKGRDGSVRAATVRMFNKAGKPTTTRRAVQRLYPIEVNDSGHGRADSTDFPITFSSEHRKKTLIETVCIKLKVVNCYVDRYF